MAGPSLTTVQVLRRRLSWIRVVPEEGLDLAGRALIPWQSIKSIENYLGLFGYGDSLDSFFQEQARTSRQSRGTGCFFTALILRFVFMPVISVLSPWPARVTIHLINGERIVLRDLEDNAMFTRMVRHKIG